MIILGFNCFGHDAAASLLIDGRVEFAVEEERLSRKKHDGNIPVNAIKTCLSYADIKISDIDYVTFSWKPSMSYSKIPVFFVKYFKHIPALIRESKNFSIEENLGMLRYLSDIKRLPVTLQNLFPEEKNSKFKFYFLEHHMCHAASAFYCSPFEDAAIMTIDGAGEWTTARLWHGKGNHITKISTINTPHSLGAFYQSISTYLGFKLIEGPGKLMGLASYGKGRNTDEYKLMRQLVTLLPEGKFRMDMRYFSYHYTRKSGVSDKFIKFFGIPNNTNGKSWSEHEYNIANAAQLIVEDVCMHMAAYLYKKTKSDNLCIAGGVGLNSVSNGNIIKNGLFKEIFIQPAAGDSGTSLGGALSLYNGILKNQRKYVMNTAFLGPEFSDDEYLLEIRKSGLPYYSNENIYDFASQELFKGKIIAWFQGRMEFGPRALGNRSIIANPCIQDMKNILNARVKFREAFRPFAASVIEEDCGKYFDCSYPDPFMLKVYKVKEEFRTLLPSITHVDQSVRIQTITEKNTPGLYKLLTTFKKFSGFPVLINTSFNIKGEPIVCNPYEALNSFKSCDMDYLIMGNYVICKNQYGTS